MNRPSHTQNGSDVNKAFQGQGINPDQVLIIIQDQGQGQTPRKF